MNPVIGLDRDGTINVDKGYISNYQNFEFIDGSLEAIKMIRDKGYDVVIITNQAGISTGEQTMQDVDEVHGYMLTKMGEFGITSINGLLYSTSNAKEDVYAKPNPGMFNKAEKEFGVDFSKGYYVGDKISDLKVAHKKKATPILVKTGYGSYTIEKLNSYANTELKKKTVIYENLLEFAESLSSLR